jgi:hypothetical protein
MLGLIRRRRRDTEQEGSETLERQDEPNPAVALAVGLIYVFRTAAGARLMRELEGAVRKYAADPQALWRLVRDGEPSPPERGEVIDTTVASPKELPQEKKELPQKK